MKGDKERKRGRETINNIIIPSIFMPLKERSSVVWSHEVPVSSSHTTSFLPIISPSSIVISDDVGEEREEGEVGESGKEEDEGDVGEEGAEEEGEEEG